DDLREQGARRIARDAREQVRCADRLDERCRGERAARLFGEDRCVVESGARAAERLGHADADRACLDQVLPESRIEAGRFRSPHALGARLGGKEVREGALEELLFFGETELHGGDFLEWWGDRSRESSPEASRDTRMSLSDCEKS